MAQTTNFEWPIPQDSAFVKGGAEAIRDLGEAIDNWAATELGSLIDEITLGSAESTIDFTDIPDDFKDLRVVLIGRGTDPSFEARPIHPRFNNDTSSDYWWHGTEANTLSSEAQSTGGNATADPRVGYMPAGSAPSGISGMCVVDIPYYTITSWEKKAGGRGATRFSSTARIAWDFWTMWGKTAAIDRLTFRLATGDWVAGSRGLLYGAK